MLEHSLIDHLLEQQAEEMTPKQSAIIKAAIELFSQQGYAATSTKEIAQKAGVAEGTIFKHYATKKELMLSITEWIIKNAVFPTINTGIPDLLAEEYHNREEFIQALLNNRLGIMHQAVPLLKLIFQEVPFQPEIRAMLVEQIQKMPYMDLVQKLRGEVATEYSDQDIWHLIMICLFGFFFLHNMVLPELFLPSQLPKDLELLGKFMDRGFSS